MIRDFWTSLNVCYSFRLYYISWLFSMFLLVKFLITTLCLILRAVFACKKILNANACFFYEILIVLTLWLVIEIVYILWLVFHRSFVVSFIYFFSNLSVTFFDYFLFDFYTRIIIIIIYIYISKRLIESKYFLYS